MNELTQERPENYSNLFNCDVGEFYLLELDTFAMLNLFYVLVLM